MSSDFCLAVHALVFLNHKACVVSSEELADNICTNPARVRKVMARLKKGGLLQTREGSEGGYQAAPGTAALPLSRVAQALDVRFVETNWRSGSTDKPCLVSSGMAGVMDDIFGTLDAGCRERLSHITIGDINGKLFGT